MEAGVAHLVLAFEVEAVQKLHNVLVEAEFLDDPYFSLYLVKVIQTASFGEDFDRYVVIGERVNGFVNNALASLVDLL